MLVGDRLLDPTPGCWDELWGLTMGRIGVWRERIGMQCVGFGFWMVMVGYLNSMPHAALLENCCFGIRTYLSKVGTLLSYVAE